MATKTETVDATAERVEPVESQPRPRHRGLAIGGIVAATALTAVALFGGGVLLGANLPDGDRVPFAQGELPQGHPPRAEGLRGPQGGPGIELHFGERPAAPGEHDQL